MNEIKRKGKIASQIQKIYRGRSTRIAFRYYKRDLKAAITIQKYIRQASLLRNKAVSIKIQKRRMECIAYMEKHCRFRFLLSPSFLQTCFICYCHLLLSFVIVSFFLLFKTPKTSLFFNPIKIYI